jgi:hypothetical protein
MKPILQIFWCISLVMMMGTVNATQCDPITYASTETIYNDLPLLIEAMWYKVPAMDVIETSVTLTDDEIDQHLYPIFYLRYPDQDMTDEPNIPYHGQDCLGELDTDTVSVKFYIWCHDFGGWSVFVFLEEEGIFHRIGRTELDFPVGTWTIIVLDGETGEPITEVPLEVHISKPTETMRRLRKRLS